MSTFVENILKSFRKIKADAVPQSPRSSKSEKIPPQPSYRPSYSTQEPEEVYVEDPPNIDTENTNPPKYGKKKNKNHENGKHKKSKSNNGEPNSNGSIIVNTTDSNNVVNIINSNNLHFGPTFHFGSPTVKQPKYDDSEDTEEDIEKSNLQQVFDADVKPELKYLMHVKNNLGRNWRCIFEKLGFTKKEIEKTEIDSEPYGVEEARFRLLYQWVERDVKNTLGKLAKFLWSVNERGIVEELAEMFNENPNSSSSRE